jgi:hypothetical protein
MTHETTITSLPVAETTRLSPTFAESPMTNEQLERLRWCANGNTLRFESSTIVEALVARGYAKEGFGRIVTVTAMGEEYLRTQAKITVDASAPRPSSQVHEHMEQHRRGE